MVIFGDGTQSRDFTYVSDTAAGILSAGGEDRVVGETINLGSGREISIAGLANEVAEVSGGRGDVQYDQPRPGDVLRLCADVGRARDLLRYEPRVAMAEGLGRLLEWYRSQGVPAERLLDEEIVRNWSVPSRVG